MMTPAPPHPRHALIFANGDPNDGEMVRHALGAVPDALVIAADGGARIARYFGRAVDAVIGDMDSISEADLRRAQDAQAAIMRYPAAKNETDLELALLYATERGADWIRVIGAVGDRLDQTLSNVYLLGLPALADSDVRLVAGKQETWLATVGEVRIDGAPGDTVSLIPLSGSVEGIRTEGMHYPLNDETLVFGPARGVSNVLDASQGIVHFRGGVLLIVHTIGRA